ncbi:MAG: hypothetical protein ACK4NY_08205 [Spirosomataceae bacterium]
MKKVYVYVTIILLTFKSIVAFSQKNPKYTYVGVEVSASSVNMVFLNIYSKGNGEFYYRIFSDSTFNIPVIDFSESTLTEAKTLINKLIVYSTVTKEIPEENITIVINSGVAIEAKRKNQEEVLSNFIFDISTNAKNPVITLTAEMEAEYSFVSSIIEKFRKEALMLNIDGANTKGGIYIDKQLKEFSPFSIKWGINSLKNAIPDNPSIVNYNKNIQKSLQQISDEITTNLHSEEAILKQSYCILGGDLAWMVSVLLKPDNIDNDLYQEFSKAQIKSLKESVSSNFENFLFTGNAKTIEGQSDLEKLKKKYDQKTLLVALNYLEKVVEIIDKEKPKRFYLVRYNSMLACHVINYFF